MEEDFNRNQRKTLIHDDHLLNQSSSAGVGGGGDAWETLHSGIEKVQTVLNQNRALIRQVNENHQSKIPVNLVKNVALINEIRGNISKVVSIYADISVNFTNIVRQRKALSNSKNAKVNDGGGNDDHHAGTSMQFR